MANTNFTTIIATTLQNFSNKILDNIATNNALLYHLKKAGNMQVVSGGRSFVEQLLYATNSSFAARNSLDVITTPATDPITAAEYDIRIVSGSVVLPTLDVAKNSGSKEQLLDYTKAKMLEAEVSMGEVLGDLMFTALATVAADSKYMDSIPCFISKTPSTDTYTTGGISSSAYSYWRNQTWATTVGSFWSLSGGGAIGINAIDQSVNNATFGRMGPKLIVSTKAIFTYYMLGLTSNIRYAPLDTGDAGFKALQYATIPWVFDDNCTSGCIYGIDTDAIKLKTLAQGNMKQTAFQVSTNQLLSSALMYMFTNLTCNSRRTNFIINSVTG